MVGTASRGFDGGASDGSHSTLIQQGLEGRPKNYAQNDVRR